MNSRTLAAAIVAGTLAVPLTGGPAPAATSADCLADTAVGVPWSAEIPEWIKPWDQLAITPDRPVYSLQVGDICDNPLDTAPVVTVRRPDGQDAHDVFTHFVESGLFLGFVGYDSLAVYAAPTGQWVATRIRVGERAADLTRPVAFTIKRATVASLTAKPTPAPNRPVAVGSVLYWTADGKLAPSPGRRVNVRARPQPGAWSGGTLLASATTDQYGRYAVRLPVTAPTWVHIEVPSTPSLGWFLTGSDETYMYHPTSLTGTANPTTSTVIRNGTKMSTYGRLSVTHNDGSTGPFAGQRVLVQTRPKSTPTGPYGTVASATTSSTGYYYANWYASVDADVRVAYVSPYKTITSAYRWIRALDVR